MKQQIRERALRAMTAALLSSDLTPKEIREVARSFKTDPSLGEQLAHLVDTIVVNLHNSPHEPKRIPPKQAETTPFDVHRFLNAIANPTLPKEDLLRRLQSYAQNPDWSPSPNWSPRKILSEFMRVAPDSSLWPALLALEAGPVESDPYVDLVMKRRKVGNG
jgi:hypothetical protein